MSRMKIAVSFVVLFGYLLVLPEAYADFAAEMQMMKSAEKHGAFIDSFAQLLHNKKEQEVVAALDPASINGLSQEQVIDALKKDVFPFFSQYKELKRYEQITKAPMPDGRVGLWHYTYIVDSDGNTKPFQIAVIGADSGFKVLSIIVGQCVKGRHPAIPPCQ